MASHQQNCDSLELQLPFNAQWLSFLIDSKLLVNSAEITQWIESVAQPFLKQWYDDWLVHPDNAPPLSMARAANSDFSKDTKSEIYDHYDSAAWDGHSSRCSCNELSLRKSLGSLDFKQYTTATACLIARYSDLGTIQENEYYWHYPAVLLLRTVIEDLEEGYYFKNLLGNAVSASDNSESEMEVDTSDANAATESLAHRMQDLSVTAYTMRMPDSSTAFSGSDEAQLEDVRARVLSFRLTDS
jgi:hypothetical protein